MVLSTEPYTSILGVSTVAHLKLPAAVGVPLGVKVTVWLPVAPKVPLALKVTPFNVLVLMV